MSLDSRKLEIKILLQDYMNFLPPGPQEAFVPVGDSGGFEDSFPITTELEKRMDRTSLVGDTYDKLDKALVWLDKNYPELYNILLEYYLHPESGHSDVDSLLVKNTSRDYIWNKMLKHEMALTRLAKYMEDEDLYVRRPEKAAGRVGRTKMEENHEELYEVFLRYKDNDNLKFSQAVKNAAFKCDYTTDHARRIIKNRLQETNG